MEKRITAEFILDQFFNREQNFSSFHIHTYAFNELRSL